MSKNANTSALIIGFAMFAVFFGAGNLVFPPLIGLMSGSSWGIAILGLAISAILFPIATIIAVDNMGGTIQSICAPVASWFTRGYMVMWIIFILTCGVPRQAGVGIESGLLSVFPSLQGNDMLRIALLAGYFLVVLILTLRPSKIVDIVGKYLTPFLLVCLAVMIALAVLQPLGTPDVYKRQQQEVMDEAKAQRAAAEQMEAELQASSNDIMRQIQAHEAKIRAQQEAARRQAEAAARAARAAKAAGRKAPPVPVYKPMVIGTGRLSRPCGGPVTSPFGYRIHPIFHTKIYHAGVDFGVPSGTPIHAADSGVVIYAGSGMRGYGNVVIIDHGGGLSTLYAHNSSLAVRAGQSVSKGQVIARAGSTGYATGPHCHFEVRRNGAPTNPMGYL